jgi:hypothetical protein
MPMYTCRYKREQWLQCELYAPDDDAIADIAYDANPEDHTSVEPSSKPWEMVEIE